MITSIDSDITYEGLCAEMKDICKFDELQPFTVKWLDEEGESKHDLCFYLCMSTSYRVGLPILLLHPKQINGREQKMDIGCQDFTGRCLRIIKQCTHD